MIHLARYFSIVILGIFLMACKNDDDPSLEGEIWPKVGYLFTVDSGSDTVYVESSHVVVTSPFLPQFPIDDNSKQWTISLPSSGEGVLIHNNQDEYWTIDSAFHPGLMVEQHFITTTTITNSSNLGEINRFRYHTSGDGNSFYIESVKFPKHFVMATGHAESGRGLLLKQQDNGTWAFWVDIDE